jgi:hypothetical protein
MKGKADWQRVECELRKRTSGEKRWVLNYRKSKKSDSSEWLEWQEWPFKKRNGSQIPPFLWTPIMVQLKRHIQRIPTQAKSYKTLLPEAIDAFKAAGKALNFKVRENRCEGHVAWWCSGKRLAVFLIADMSNVPANRSWKVLAEELRDLSTDAGHRFRKMERDSRALLRIAYVVGKGGFCKLVPGALGPAKRS